MNIKEIAGGADARVFAATVGAREDRIRSNGGGVPREIREEMVREVLLLAKGRGNWAAITPGTRGIMGIGGNRQDADRCQELRSREQRRMS